jgi:hypothetical protein
MLLSEKVFQSIFGICILDYSNDASERREHPRVEFGQRATAFRLIDNTPGRAQIILIRDMSIKGVGTLQSEPLQSGDEFMLDVSKFVGRPLGIRCSVERCERGGSGGTQFVIGATFEQLIESPELLTPAPEPEVAEIATPRPRRQPILARIDKLLARRKWKWLERLRQGAILARRLRAR